jgi:hypothetical protein
MDFGSLITPMFDVVQHNLAIAIMKKLQRYWGGIRTIQKRSQLQKDRDETREHRDIYMIILLLPSDLIKNQITIRQSRFRRQNYSHLISAESYRRPTPPSDLLLNMPQTFIYFFQQEFCSVLSQIGLPFQEV